MKKIVIGITGASGSIYAKRMIEVLASQDITVHVISTDTGKKVFHDSTSKLSNLIHLLLRRQY